MQMLIYMVRLRLREPSMLLELEVNTTSLYHIHPATKFYHVTSRISLLQQQYMFLRLS